MPVPNPLEELIAKLTLEISREIPTEDVLRGQAALAAIMILTQAQLMIESNPAKAQLFYTRARSLMRDKKLEDKNGWR